MPYAPLPDGYQQHDSLWVDYPNSNFDPATGQNDVALWHLTAPINFFGNYAAAPVRPRPSALPDGKLRRAGEDLYGEKQ